MHLKLISALAMTLALDSTAIPTTHPELCSDAIYNAPKSRSFKIDQCGGTLQPCDAGNCTTGPCYYRIIPCVPKA